MASSNSVAIPRVLHRIWVGGVEPEWMRRLADTWQQHHPAWTLHQWTDENIPDLFPLDNQDVYDRAHLIAPKNTGQLRADVLRYELLYRHGGVYVDADFECLAPIDAYLGGAGCFAAWEVPGEWIANGIMGAVPQHPFVRRLIDGIPASIRAQPKSKPNVTTGPQYLTGLWREHPDDVDVWPKERVYPYLYGEFTLEDGPFDMAVAVHHWNNYRTRKNRPPPLRLSA